ncbi:hypothetical protein AKJ57_03970 [candidate division MSBL1 archaeon SCGC-AAA259A05]|uniref:Xylose isomerase-like TIM barrel domain-containing protein n=1 Tax=candidate division MSBL1 archaeon SCGC-AAA259A05 TaxID=1698259 RepID=A0A133U923_9EURY|nr:hypothetical protein AKJ57_03970 [candidate division MSBL1 archaeon SCGC-AAA259A05]
MDRTILETLNVVLRFGYQIFTNPEEIHVEDIFLDETYDKLLNYVKNHECICMLSTLNEFEYCKANHAIELNKNEFEKKLRERYSELKEHCRIGLHTHLARGKSIERLDYGEQRKKIRNGIDFLESLGIETSHFAPGWWSWNQNTIKACKDLGIKHFHLVRGQRGNFDEGEGIELVTVNHYCHDFNL